MSRVPNAGKVAFSRVPTRPSARIVLVEGAQCCNAGRVARFLSVMRAPMCLRSLTENAHWIITFCKSLGENACFAGLCAKALWKTIVLRAKYQNLHNLLVQLWRGALAAIEISRQVRSRDLEKCKEKRSCRIVFCKTPLLEAERANVCFNVSQHLRSRETAGFFPETITKGSSGKSFVYLHLPQIHLHRSTCFCYLKCATITFIA